MIKDVTDLEVYQQSLEVLPRLYELLKQVPYSERDTIFQTKRAAKAIPGHIAEGFAKRAAEKEFKRYLMIAIGSSDEVITHLRVLSIVVLNLDIESVSNEYRIISKRLNTLHKNWHSTYNIPIS